MKAVLPLFIFIDACGWEIIRNHPFLRDLAPNRKRLSSVFGYSSACVPSILSGRWPVEHRNWCYFVYDPRNSPFKSLRPLRWLPSLVTSRRIFRRRLSRLIKARLSFRGYFDLYNIPFKYISLFDFTEKRSPLQPRGMNRGANIFDYLEERKIDYHSSSPDQDEAANLAGLAERLRVGKIDFAFLYLPELDGLLHHVGNDSPLINTKLRQYEDAVRRLVAQASENYREVRLYLFSDHGMANCSQHLDLKRQIEELPLTFGHDYAAVYDSTMARFWFLNERARQLIADQLRKVPQGRILADEELEEMGTLFTDRYFGEMIFLVREGVLIVPSHMGARPIRAMHGYHPSDPQSYAVICTNQDRIPEQVSAIPDLFRIMTAEADQAKVRNAEAVRENPKPEIPNPKQIQIDGKTEFQNRST